MGLGRASVHDLVAGDVLVPPGFTCALGVPKQPGRLTDLPSAPQNDLVQAWRRGLAWSRRLPAAENSRKSIAAHAPTIGARQVNSAYHRRVAFPSELGNSTSRQLQSTSPALIVPVGSTEQHGPHLPLDTDTRIATAVARAVAERLADGDESHTGCWRRRSATAPAASTRASRAPSRSAPRRCVFCWSSSAGRQRNGRRASSSSTDTAETSRRLAAAAALLQYEGRDVGWCSCTVANADAHAGHTETSVLLHISPKDVWIDERLPGNSAPLAESDAAACAAEAWPR